MGTAVTAPSQDSKNMAVIAWIGGIPLGFIPALFMYVTRKDDAFLQDQSKEALNWFITGTIAYIAGMILTVILVGILIIGAVLVCHLAFCIMGAMAASKGESYRVPLPFTLRLLK